MNNLEKLNEARKNLDKVLEEVKKEQSKIIDEIKKKRNTGWDRMFDDLYALNKYSRFIDTGIGFFSSSKQTLGFEIREDYINVISWEHLDPNGKEIEPRKDACFFSITKEEPFKEQSHFSYVMKDIVYAVENWDDVLKEIEKRLEKQLESEMKKKIADSAKKQIELENQLKAISHSVQE